jgi:transposase
LADIEDGETVRSVAQKNNVSQQTIYNWLKSFRANGYHAFDDHGRRPIKYASIEKARELKVISENYTGEEARKIRVVYQMLMGKKRTEIAKEAGASSSSLYKWTAAFVKGGVAELLKVPERRCYSTRITLRKDIEKRDILRVAACVSERSARRLQAIASLLDGKTLEEVAGDLGMSKSSISKWGISFNKGGVVSLMGKVDRNASGDIEHAPRNQR